MRNRNKPKNEDGAAKRVRRRDIVPKDVKDLAEPQLQEEVEESEDDPELKGKTWEE